MTSPLRCLALLAGAVLWSAAALAAGPTGTWTWTVDFNGQSIPSSARLVEKDGQLSGTLTGRLGQTPISEGSFKDGVVAFTLVRDYNGEQFKIKYHGRLEGDTITGSIDFPGLDGGKPLVLAWKAARQVEGEKAGAPGGSK